MEGYQMKVAELEGGALDYWVAKAKGDYPYTLPSERESYCIPNYSTDWSQGGPIIERERIDTTWSDVWFAVHNAGGTDERKWKEFTGPTPLIAAMRVFVYSKFGEEVDDSQAP